jgi:hypothetical protein
MVEAVQLPKDMSRTAPTPAPALNHLFDINNDNPKKLAGQSDCQHVPPQCGKIAISQQEGKA